MVKLQKGKGNHNKGGKPRPLFPPGELPLFGPPPAYVRRPSGPPPPPPRAPRPRPLPLGFGPPLPPGPPGPRRMPLMPPPPLMGPPRPPRPHRPPPPPPMRRRGPPGPPLPPPPMMLHPMMNPHPPPPPPFMRGPPRRPLMGPPFRGRVDKMGNRLRRTKPNNKAKKKKNNKKEDDNRYQGDFLCETCDRSWETEEELEEHLASHVVCDADGCSFTAHRKVVDLHYKMQHATGLFDKIPKTSDSKEIEAWIAERKKRYPTKERVDSLEAEHQEKIARREVLEDPTTQPKLSSTPKDIRSNRNKQKLENQSGAKRPMNPKKERRPPPPRFVMGNVRIEIVDGLPPDYASNKKAAIEAASAPAPEEEPESKINISDEEWEAEPPSADTSKNMCTVLSALCAAYDSNISDDDAPPTEIKAVVSKVGDEEPIDESLNKTDSAIVEQKTEAVPEKNPRKRARKRPAKEEANKRARPPPPPPPPSLLQKLLVKEIRKERNQILQCVGFIVENNFFEPSTNLPVKCASSSHEESSVDKVTIS